MDRSVATVFGGTGFLGRRIVSRLAESGWYIRVAVRHPDQIEPADNLVGVYADVEDQATVEAAVEGATAVVNAVSLYVEKGGAASNYRSVHEDGAANVARVASLNGVLRLVHISGIGADSTSGSRFIAARGRGEDKVRKEFSDATIIRPGVMFGEDDRFFNSLAQILTRSPIFPLIGGSTHLQPVDVDDVARGVVHALDRNQGTSETFDLGGPDIATMRELVEWLRETLSVSRPIIPVPTPLALFMARLFEWLPSPPLTVAQVELLAKDNVTQPGVPGFEQLEIQPRSFRETVASYVRI